MYEAIGSALGHDIFSDARPKANQFIRHVSAAYVNSDSPLQPIADAVNSAHPQPVTVTLDTASLLVLHRDHGMYEWTQTTPLPIGAKD
jgi:hypothetical protein